MSAITTRRIRHSFIAAAVLQALVSPAHAAVFTWNAGSLSTAGLPALLAGADTLTIGVGAGKVVDTNMTTAGTVNWSDSLSFQYGNGFTNSGNWQATADVSLLNSYAGGAFSNSGSFAKTGGLGATAIGGGISFTNSGNINAQIGTISFDSGAATFNAGSSFTGTGVVLVTSNAAFNGGFTSANLQLAAGSFAGAGAQINGSVRWSGGTLTGDWQLAAGSTLTIQNSGAGKILNGSLSNQGTIAAQDNLYFQYNNPLNNQGLVDLQADVALLNSYAGGTFSNSGTLRKSAGLGTSSIGSGITFVNNGTVAAQTGTISFDSGAATFNDGTQFTGAGQVVVNSNAVFLGGFSTNNNLSLVAGTYTGGDGSVGNPTSQGVMNGNVNWSGGTLTGSWRVSNGKTLTIQNSGSTKLLNGSLSNQGTIAAQDNLYFQYNNPLNNQGLVDLQGDVALLNSYAGGTFNNNGTLRKSAGSGTSSIGSGITFVNNGTVAAQTGTISFDSGAAIFNDGTQFTGAGQVVVTSNAVFLGGFSTNNNLTLVAGTFTGGDGSVGNPTSQGVMNSNVNWSGGTLIGTWQLQSGKTLTIQNSAIGKLLNGSLSNQGSIASQDHLYFQYGNTLTNQGLVDLLGDFSLLNGYGGGTVTNSGTLRKSLGSGTSSIGSAVTFNNTGTVQAQIGTISFDSGVVNFNAGSQFTGAGQVLVTNNAAFNGAFQSQNLYLTGGTWTGTGAQANGVVTWTGGSMVGDWMVASGASLKVAPGGSPILNGSMNNLGTVTATNNLGFQYGNTWTNAGKFDLQSDVGLYDAYGGGNFVNNGLVVKSAGTGVSDVSRINFSNAAGGVVNVQTGSIALSANFNNAGTLKGTGAFTSNLVTNNGHMAPGDPLGTLALNGSFAQTAFGSFDVGLGGLGGSGLLAITGSAALGGTLDLLCYGNCSYAVGQTIVILTASGGVSGTFSGAPVLSGFSTGAFTVSYANPNQVLLTVTQATVAAVPEPATWALLLCGVALIGGIARRRTATA